ncbi:MAG: DUF3575 domain-containing protein [Bacteroidia bacterium]
MKSGSLAQQPDSGNVSIQKSSPIYSESPVRRATALKVGLLKGHLYFGYLSLSVEREIKRNWSVQVDLGCLPFNYSGSQYASFFAAGLFGEARYYFALRKHPLAGFYIGPHLGGNYNLYFRYANSPIKNSKGWWGQAGASVGFQYSFWSHWLAGVGIKGGYSGTIYSRYFWKTGTLAGDYADPQPLSFYLSFCLGYKF